MGGHAVRHGVALSSQLMKHMSATPGLERPRLDHIWHVLLQGQIQHPRHHAGQIAMLGRGLGKALKG